MINHLLPRVLRNDLTVIFSCFQPRLCYCSVALLPPSRDECLERFRCTVAAKRRAVPVVVVVIVVVDDDDDVGVRARETERVSEVAEQKNPLGD